MKKVHFIYLAIVVVLGIVAFMVWSHRNTTLAGRETNFRLHFPEQINGIEINQNEHSASLYKLNNKWMINNEEANQDKVKALLLAASQIEMAAPVSLSAEDSVRNAIDQGVSVNFYQGEKQVKSYTFNIWNNQYFAEMQRARNPYRIKIAGYGKIDLLRLFVADEDAWLSNVLINFSPQSLQRIQVAYPQNPDQSFGLLANREQTFMLFDYQGNEMNEQASQSAIQDYLHFFSGIRYATNTENESIAAKQKPLFHLLIQTDSNDKFLLTGYPITDPATGETDPFIFLGDQPELGLLKLNYSDFDPILVPLDYFVKK